MADYLKKPAEKEEIKLRNEAIAELQPMTDWRQDFQAFGMSTEDEIQHVKALKIWLKEPPFVKGNKWLTAAAFLAPVWMLFQHFDHHFLPSLASYYFVSDSTSFNFKKHAGKS